MNRWLFCTVVLVWVSMNSCNRQAAEEGNGAAAVGTPVTITHIASNDMVDYIELSATSTFLQKAYVKSITNGYIKAVYTAPGKLVKKGQVLFTMQTKESETIGNAVNNIDPTFKFSGVIQVKAAENGYITQLNHQPGDYVQDGEQLAVINNTNTFVFILNLPFELKPYLALNERLKLQLPDSTQLSATLGNEIPMVDAASQVQSIVLKVDYKEQLPENLIAKVYFKKNQKLHTYTLPKAALLTNDVQSEYWIMKMIDSNTAAKVNVKKGLEMNEMVEILEPNFSANDQILISGNYGLPDTAKVQIQH